MFLYVFYCLSIDRSFTVRLTDSALAVDLFQHDYTYIEGLARWEPIKWQALETLGDNRVFSPATDVVGPITA